VTQLATKAPSNCCLTGRQRENMQPQVILESSQWTRAVHGRDTAAGLSSSVCRHCCSPASHHHTSRRPSRAHYCPASVHNTTSVELDVKSNANPLIYSKNASTYDVKNGAHATASDADNVYDIARIAGNNNRRILPSAGRRRHKIRAEQR
jgi:hypothetical protein